MPKWGVRRGESSRRSGKRVGGGQRGNKTPEAGSCWDKIREANVVKRGGDTSQGQKWSRRKTLPEGRGTEKLKMGEGEWGKRGHFEKITWPTEKKNSFRTRRNELR